ncbi:interleukin 12Ba isoform X1 [Amphiprion ocellaris]|uniref:Interleukin-12 subunit beta n=2 Tax=Amphiprion ocellaris TaxID=80972 RepID=A0A3Q1BAS5_AMPOC|nr:interleukin 12Ba isoform X1 [Amphiprion ocellaris]
MSHSFLTFAEVDTMKLFVFTVVCAFLHVSYQIPRSHWTLLPNILVVEVDGTLGQQPLSCIELPEELMRIGNQSQGIFWKKNGKEEAQRGNSYLVRLEESLGGGNYTCHSKDGSLLNHTVVLISEDETKRRKILVKNDKEDYLKCSAQNYNGEFHCSWAWHPSRVGKVAFIKARRVSDNKSIQCSLDSGSQLWMCSSDHSNFSCTVDDSVRRISCLDKQHCPYAEESQPIHITVYVKTKQFLVENYSKHFYLSEIVKPDKVRIVKINSSVIEWSYPRSWSSPYSYFPLTFQIAQLRGECRRCNNPCTDSKAATTTMVQSPNICQFQVWHKAKAVCVRAKDAICDSQWSEWSHLSLRGSKKNRRHNKEEA